MVASSLKPNEFSLGKVGGGVLILSSKLCQKPRPAEFLMACWVNVLDEERLLAERSLSMVISSGISSRGSGAPAVAGCMLGEDEVVAG